MRVLQKFGVPCPEPELIGSNRWSFVSFNECRNKFDLMIGAWRGVKETKKMMVPTMETSIMRIIIETRRIMDLAVVDLVVDVVLELKNLKRAVVRLSDR